MLNEVEQEVSLLEFWNPVVIGHRPFVCSPRGLDWLGVKQMVFHPFLINDIGVAES